VFNVAASATATATYVALVGALEAVFTSSGIRANLGGRIITTTWLAAAFSLFAVPLWLAGVCCCSGKLSENRKAIMIDEPALPTSEYQPLVNNLPATYRHGSKGSVTY
jgi:hypothetical protein